MENGDHGNTENDHGDGLAEIELHETHAIHVGLSWSGKKGDAAGLCGHDRKRYGVPWNRSISEEKTLDVFFAAGLPDPKTSHEKEEEKHHHPVYATHSEFLIDLLFNTVCITIDG